MNVAVPVTAPETSLPETETPLMPVSATVNLGSEPIAPAVPGRMNAPAVASRPVVAMSAANRLVICLGLRLVGSWTLGGSSALQGTWLDQEREAVHHRLDASHRPDVTSRDIADEA